MYVAYGDWMVLHPERPNYRVKGSNWFFPGLIKEKNPTPVITGWLKTYLQDTEASAGGLRPGVSNYLAQFMPVEFIVPVTQSVERLCGGAGPIRVEIRGVLTQSSS
jgi:hypothetical protein